MRSWGIFRVLHQELYPQTLSPYASVSSESPTSASYYACPMLSLSFSIQPYTLDLLSDLPRSPVPSCAGSPLSALGRRSPLSAESASKSESCSKETEAERLSRTGEECSLVAKHSSPSIRYLYLNYKLLMGDRRPVI